MRSRPAAPRTRRAASRRGRVVRSGAMAKRLFLPVAVGEATPRPTVDTVRRRLGGRAATEPGAGGIVRFRDDRGLDRTGVIVFVRGDDLDIWLDGDVVRRVRRGDARPADGMVAEALVAAARDAEAFAALREGQRVQFQQPSGLAEGSLVEKCRFGALVERTDRTVLGVGFRRLWDAERPGHPSV